MSDKGTPFSPEEVSVSLDLYEKCMSQPPMPLHNLDRKFHPFQCKPLKTLIEAFDEICGEEKKVSQHLTHFPAQK